MADISKIKIPGDNTEYNIKDALSRSSMIHYIVGPSTDTIAGTWTGVDNTITEYYNGLNIVYVPAVAGASTTKLNINGFGAKTCYYSGTSKLTTHFAAGTPINFVYKDDTWTRADYNSNSDTQVRQTLQTGDANRPLLMSYAQTSSTTTNVDNVSYRNNSIYANPSTGTISATKYKIDENVTLEYNSTTQSLDFIFA